MTLSDKYEKRYKNMLSYSKKLNEYGQDILHDSWLYWMENKNEDLLTTHEGTWKRVLQYRTNYYRRTNETNRIGGKEQKTFKKLIFDEESFSSDKSVRKYTKDSYFNSIINHITVSSDLTDYKLLDSISVPEHLVYAYEIITTGQNQLKVGNDKRKELKEVIKNQIKKSQEITMSFNNPFAGSKLVVKKTLTELQWEKREDKEDFELYDYNETYNLYQHKLSKEGWLVKLKDHKINPYIKNLVDRGN